MEIPDPVKNIRYPLLVLLMGLTNLAGTALADPGLWTAPQQPIANHAATVLLSRPGAAYDAHGAGLAPPAPRIAVEGNTLLVDLDQAQASSPGDWPEVLMQFDLPPLDAGEWTLKLYEDRAHTRLLGEHTLQVVEGSLPRVLPAVGHWYNPSEPGTGFSIESRGGTLSMIHYTYLSPVMEETGRAAWFVSVAPLHGGEAVAGMLQYAGGSCFHCTPFEAPHRAGYDTLGLRVVFESDRRGWVEFRDGRRTPIVSMPWGAPYVQGLLDRGIDGENATLAIPDMVGDWVFGSTDASRFSARFGPMQPIESGAQGQARWRSTVQIGATLSLAAELTCAESVDSSDQRIRCELLGDWQPTEDAAVQTLRLVMQAENMQEDFVRGLRLTDNPADAGVELQGFRIELPENRFTSERGIQPQPGWWWDPARSGTGMFVQRRGAQTGISYYGAEGWAISVRPLADRDMYATGQRYRDGSCAYLGCLPDYLAPNQVEDDLPLRWDLSHARSGIGWRFGIPATRFGEFVAMALGGAYRHELGTEDAPVAMPELLGTTWVFVLESDSQADEWQRRVLNIGFFETHLDFNPSTLMFLGRDLDDTDQYFFLTCRDYFWYEDHCTFAQSVLGPGGLPQPEDPVSQWSAQPNDIAIDRLVGRWQSPSGDVIHYVRGFRLVE